MVKKNTDNFISFGVEVVEKTLNGYILIIQ
jgi:hypothetical protein